MNAQAGSISSKATLIAVVVASTYTALAPLLLMAPETPLKQSFEFLAPDLASNLFMLGAVFIVVIVVPLLGEPARTRRVYAAFLGAAIVPLPGLLAASAYSLEPVGAVFIRQFALIAVALTSAGAFILFGRRQCILAALACSAGLPSAAFVLYQFGGVESTWLYYLSPFMLGLGVPSPVHVVLWAVPAGLLGGAVYWRGGVK